MIDGGWSGIWLGENLLFDRVPIIYMYLSNLQNLRFKLWYRGIVECELNIVGGFEQKLL